MQQTKSYSKKLVLYSWDIIGISVANETNIILNQQIRLTSNIWLYNQSKYHYFKAYQQYELDDKFYTSDYDFSDFNLINLGIGMMRASLLIITIQDKIF